MMKTRRRLSSLFWALLFSGVPSPECGAMGPLRQVNPPSAAVPYAPVTVEVGETVYLGAGATGDLPMTFQWWKDGVELRGAAGQVSPTATPTLYSAQLRIAQVQFSDAGEYRAVFRNQHGADASGVIKLVVVEPVPAVITRQPVSQAVSEGSSATFTTAATGTSLCYQWQKDGNPIPAATLATLTIARTSVSDSGAYAVVVRGGGVAVTSDRATLTVSALQAPVFAVQPESRTVADSGVVAFRAVAADADGYVWRKDGEPMAGATHSTLILYGVGPRQAGRYSVVASNRAGSTASRDAILTVAPEAGGTGRLTNVSVLAPLNRGEWMSIGCALRGTAPDTGALVRVAGPSLAPLGVAGFSQNPRLTFARQYVPEGQERLLVAGDDWAGAPAVRTAAAKVGAFPFIDAASQDAAVFIPAIPAGTYLFQASDAEGVGGTVLAELYLVDGADATTAATSRWFNLSVQVRVANDGVLSAGFVVEGKLATTLLLRAVGPTLGLAPFGVEGAMADPELAVFDSRQRLVAQNDNWGGDETLAAAASRVGAFQLSGRASKDAVVAITLLPGAYTVQLSPVAGTLGGKGLIEIYEVR